MSTTTQTIIDGTLDIVRQELDAAYAAELDALYAIETAAAIVADSLTRSAAMDQAQRKLRHARLAQTQLSVVYYQLLEQLEVKVAPIAAPIAAPVAPVAYDVRLPNPPMPRRRSTRATPAAVVALVDAPVASVAAPVSYDVRLPNPPMPRRRTAR
jgi:hypothetical protein